MASFDSNSSPCQIVRRSCTLRPICSQCERECSACMCFHCTAHGHTYKLCHQCFTNRRDSHGAGWVRGTPLDLAVLAESWCRLQRGKGIYLAADRD